MNKFSMDFRNQISSLKKIYIYILQLLELRSVFTFRYYQKANERNEYIVKY